MGSVWSRTGTGGETKQERERRGGVIQDSVRTV